MTTLNPVLVKELRQAVRSNFVVAAMCLLVLIQMITTGVALANADMAIASYGLSSQGQQIFMAMLSILSGGCLFFIPAYCGFRLAVERAPGNVDLLFITSITPWTAIRGKVLSGVVLTVLFFSTSAPFMVLTYLMRGIDIPTMLVALCVAFLYVIAAIQAAIVVACVPASRLFKVLLALATAGVFVIGISPMVAVTFELLRSGYAGLGLGVSSAIVVAAMLLLYAGIMAVMHVFSTAMIMPESANRALPVRLTVTAAWAASLITFLILAAYAGMGPLYFWCGLATGCICIAMLIALSESERLSVRVRMTIPRGLLRIPAFLFYNGPVAGVIWSLVLFGMTVGITLIACDVLGFFHAFPKWSHSRPGEANLFIATCGGVMAYVYAYAMTAVLLYRLLLHRWLAEKVIGLAALLLMAIGAFMPWMWVLMTGSLDHPNFPDEVMLGNITALLTTKAPHLHIFFAFIWAAIMTCVNIHWYGRQILAFKRHIPATPPEPTTETTANEKPVPPVSPAG
ncbi:MAG: hypothetical protein WCL44_08880 [bacterium]